MNLRLLPIIFCLFVFALSGFAQTEETGKVAEFGEVNCEMILAYSDGLLNELNKNPTSIAYLIFYEGKHSQYTYNKKTKKLESKLFNPRYGEARNRTKAVTLYLTKWRKVSKDRFELIDGGYNSEYRVELWVLPIGAEPPKPSPTLERKDIKIRRGKPPRVADCQANY